MPSAREAAKGSTSARVRVAPVPGWRSDRRRIVNRMAGPACRGRYKESRGTLTVNPVYTVLAGFVRLPVKRSDAEEDPRLGSTPRGCGTVGEERWQGVTG